MGELKPEDKAIIEKLDKPGAGVPFYQKLALRYWYGPRVAAKSDWDKDSAAFKSLNAKIFRAIEGLDDAQLSRRVLVKPIRGLEDSSRYWSAAMVLEHLHIVGKAIAGGVILLSNGTVPDRKADTARVKPAGEVTPKEAVAAYRAFADTIIEKIDREAGDRKAPAKYEHPWFGPFTAHQWHWLLATHCAIHLQQIRQIAEAVKAPKA